MFGALIALALAALIGAAVFFLGFRPKLALPGRIRKVGELIDLGRLDEAQSVLRPLEERHKGKPELLWLRARIESQMGHYLISIVALNDLLRGEMFPAGVDEAAIRRELAKLYEKTGRERDALTEYYLLADKEPENAEAHLKIGKYHWEKRNFEEAEKFLRKAVVLDRADLEAPLYLARLYQQTEKIAQSEPYLQQILAKAGDHAEALYRMGLVAFDRKDNDRTTEYCARAVELGGEWGAAAAGKQAQVEEQRGNDDQALVLLEQAVGGLPPGRPELQESLHQLINLATKKKSWNHLQEALAALETSYPEDPKLANLKNVFSFLLDSAPLRDFFGGESVAVKERAKQLLERNGYNIDEDKTISDSLIVFRSVRVLPGMPRQREFLVWIWFPDLVSRTQMSEIVKWSKQDQARSTSVFTPFDFTVEALAYAKPMALHLYSGDKLLSIITGQQSL